MSIYLESQISDLISEALLPHPKVINNQSKVLVHPIEVLELRSHLVRLLIQILYLDLSRSDVSLKLFDFVVKHELELLKLLCLLLELEYAVVFLLYCLLAF